MNLVVAVAKDVQGSVLVEDGITHSSRYLQSGEELFLNDKITPQEANAKVTVLASEEIILHHGDNLILDESVVTTESFVEDTSISQESLNIFLTSDMATLDGILLSQNEDINFADIVQNSEEQNIKYENNIDIKDIMENQNSEIKIFSEETSKVSLDQSEWIKQDSQIVENGHSFDVYSNASTDVSTLLIEDGITIFDNHG